MLNYRKITTLAIPLLILTIFLISSPVSAAGLADSAQPKFHHDQNNTGQSPYKGPQNNETKWNYTTGNMIGYSSPAIGKNGTVYIGSGDSYLYAFTSTGKLKWRYKTGDAVQSSPTIDKNGNIYFGSCDNRLYALTSAGKLKWKYQTGSAVESSPTIGSDGTIYFGSCDGKVYALTSAGKLKWKYQTSNFIISSPALGSDGTIYIGSEDQYFYALSSTGKLKWRYKTGKAIYSDPVIRSSTIYTGSGDGYLYALTSAGKLKWKYKTGKEIYSLAAGKNGIIYVGNRDGKLYALNSSGKLKWTYTTGNSIRSSPAIGSDGTLYFGSHDGKLYALKSSGKLLWKYQIGSGIEGSPAIASNGTLYFGSLNSKFYAIQDVYVYATPPAGSYNKAKTITLTMNRNGDIYYTLNGSNPTSKSTKYTKALSITKSTTLKYFAVDTAGYKSQIYTQKYTIETIPPTITSIDPKNSTTKVATNKTIKVTFNENIKKGSNWIELKNSKGKKIAFKTSISGKILTIKPNNKLAESQYKLILHTGSITDLAGNPVAAKTTKFSVGTPPKIAKIDPKNGATKVSTGKTIKVTFNESIKKSSKFRVELKNSAGKKIAIKTSTSGKTLTIKPTKKLAESRYKLTIYTGSITDLAGNPLAVKTTTFTTGTPPKITKTDPKNSAKNIARNKTIKVTFNENIKKGINYWIELKDSKGKKVTIKKSIKGKVLSITHSKLNANTKYKLTLHTGAVTDKAGNPVTLKTINFTTRRT